VRYSPEIETIDPDIEEYMTRIIDFRERTVRESPARE
jgi:CBS domain containing-hemolysin-like protein